MHYEINVARNGRHFFATDKRSLTTEGQAREAYLLLKKAFPSPEFEVRVTRMEEYGYGVDFEKKDHSVTRLSNGQPSQFWDVDSGSWTSNIEKASLLTQREAEDIRTTLLKPLMERYQSTGKNYHEIHVTRMIDGSNKPLYAGVKVEDKQ